MADKGREDAIANRPEERAKLADVGEAAEQRGHEATQTETAVPDGQLPRDVVKGGDRSKRAAVSGATGERHPGGGHNKPEPKDPDQKAQAGPRNR